VQPEGDDRAVGAGAPQRVHLVDSRSRDDPQLGMALLHLPNFVRRDPRRVPHVAELARAAERAPAYPDLRRRLRQWARCRALERPELAGERRLAAPKRAHEPDRLVGASPTLAERDAEEAELVLVPADPDSELQPPARDLLQRRGL